MTVLRDCTDPATWWPHIDEATRALAVGGLVVVPTDTVYGIAADAFKPDAVQALLDAKGRGRHMPPPVLIGDVRTLDGLADGVTDEVRALVEKFWPGPLTVVLRAQPSLQWDLGETHGTVALRMPEHDLTLALLRRTGPLAVSSANTTGSPAATTAAAAEEMLGESVRVILDGGTSPGGVASTIVDATGDQLRILREGALSAEDLGIPEPAEESVEAEAEEQSDQPVDGAETQDEPTAAADAAGEATPSTDPVDDIVVKPRRTRTSPTEPETTEPVPTEPEATETTTEPGEAPTP